MKVALLMHPSGSGPSMGPSHWNCDAYFSQALESCTSCLGVLLVAVGFMNCQTSFQSGSMNSSFLLDAGKAASRAASVMAQASLALMPRCASCFLTNRTRCRVWPALEASFLSDKPGSIAILARMTRIMS